MEIIIGLIGGLACILIGVFVAKMFYRTKNQQEIGLWQEKLNHKTEQLEATVLQKQTLQTQNTTLQTTLAKQTATQQHLEEKLQTQKEELVALQTKFTKEFENLANKLLDTKSEKFTKQNKENIDLILKPLQEKIDRFEKRVEDTHKDTIDKHAALRQQIKQLNELNSKMSKETSNLTRALKGDTKTQGNWGELVLERVLEKSGLEKNREYFIQPNFTLDSGKRLMPDVVLHLPENRKMIVDSKVSLVAYERFQSSEDDIDKQTHLKAHLVSLKTHVDQLSQKQYQKLYDMESPDFVLLFVPIEPAFALALEQDNSLYNWAFDKNIVIVTPTTLLATLRTVESMWKHEKQQRNAVEIAKHAGALYDSFCNLTDELLKMGRQIGTVQTTYDNALKKLTGKRNLVDKVEKLKQLGVKASKQIDQKLLSESEE